MRDEEKPAFTRNFIDKTVGYFNPRAGLQRDQARLAMAYISQTRRFDAASKTSRFEQWKRPGSSANSSILPALPMLRNASRDLTRNNPWHENALRVIVNNTVGAGIDGKVTNERLDVLWTRWAETSEIDADGRLDISGLQALALNTIAESGAVIIRRRYRRGNSGLTIPVQVQILEPDYLDSSKDGLLSDGSEIIGGIEYNKRGEPVAYWLRECHPGDIMTFRSAVTSYRIPASEIIYAFDPKRAGQGHGYPWGASGIRRLKDFDDYEDAQLVRQKIAACFAGFVEDMAPPAGATGLEKTGPTSDQKDYMQPGMWEYLRPGKKITFASPPTVQNYGEYGRFNLLGVAAAYGITYESMTGDYSNVNFSSGRMGWLEMHRNISRWQNTIMRVQILERIAAWFFGGCTLMGYPNEGEYIKWTYPKREMIDPTKEIPATIKALRAGLTTLERVHASQGMDTPEVLAEIEKTNKALDDKGLILDSDPRKVNISGGLNEPEEPEPPPAPKK